MKLFKPFANLNRIKHINLREQLRSLFYDNETAHWIVYRRFDLTKKSKNWVDLTKEVVNGYAWEYEDELVLTRRSWPGQSFAPVGTEEVFTQIGLLDSRKLRYYFLPEIKPKNEDVIFEIEYGGREKPKLSKIKYVSKFNITAVFPMREQNFGRLEYYVVLVEVDEH